MISANLFVPLESFRYTQGEALLSSYKPPEAKRFTHVFCSVCGSSLPFLNLAREQAVVPMGSLDDDSDRLPEAHIFVDSMASWFKITDSLPRFSEYVDDAPKTTNGPSKFERP